MDRAFGAARCSTPTTTARFAISVPIIESAHAAGVLVAVATDLLALHAARAARRDGRRRRRRQLAAVRRAARLRRPARGVLRDARGVRPAGAGPDHRRVGRRARAAGVSHGARRRASSTSAARRRRRTSARRRRCSPTSRRCTRCITARRGLRAIARRIHALARDARGRARAALGLRQTNAAYFDTLRIEGADVEARSRRGRARRASTSATRRRRHRHLARRDDDARRCRGDVSGVFAGRASGQAATGRVRRCGAADRPLSRTSGVS